MREWILKGEQELRFRTALGKPGQFPEAAPAGAGLLFQEQPPLIGDPCAVLNQGNGFAARLFLGERFGRFRAAMDAAGLPAHDNWIVECDHTLKGGVTGFGRLQKQAARPTAIVCSNDMTAIGVLRAAYMEGCLLYTSRCV